MRQRKKRPQEGVDYVYRTAWVLTVWLYDDREFAVSSTNLAEVRKYYDDIISLMRQEAPTQIVYEIETTDAVQAVDVRQVQRLHLGPEERTFDPKTGKPVFFLYL